MLQINSNLTLIIRLCICMLFISLCISCSTDRRTRVRNYPTDTAFVFSHSITITGKLEKEERRRLQETLETYWDDSARTQRATQFGVFYRIKNPPIFDTANISRSINFMNSYLRSQGYYSARFTDTSYVKTFRDQRRAYIDITVDAGPNTTIDSISFTLGDTTLQRLAMEKRSESLLIKGKPISKELVSAELERLVRLYRSSGYMRIMADNFYAEVDTFDANLLTLTTDLLEQSNLLAEAARRRQNNPTIDVDIRLRPVNDSSLIRDSSSLMRYAVGNVYFYPETSPTEIPDSVLLRTDFNEIKRREYTMRYYDGLFKYRPLREHTYMRRGRLYNETEYYRTLNSFSQISAWQQVDGRLVPRDKDSVDVHLFMIPADKLGTTLDFELSRNTGDFLGGNLAGISVNFNYINRNLWRSAVESNTTLRNGVELSLNSRSQTNARLLQTIISSLGHTISIPRIVLPQSIFRPLFGNRSQYNGMRTLISANGAYTDRFNFYRLRSVNASFGYEWSRKRITWKYQPINVEVYSLDTLPLLQQAFETNGFLRTAFNTGRVVSQVLTMTAQWDGKGKWRNGHLLRLGVEEAGGILGVVKSLRDRLYRYAKLNAEYVHSIRLGSKQAVAMRAMGGIGYNYGTADAIDSVLPFFKQFVAGGPNSMRAWNLRQIGLGSSLVSDTSSSFRDRFGDMQLEFNAEYRFPLAQISTLKIGSCLFADVGNLWNLRPNADNPNSSFNFRRLGRDLAVGVGTGLRLDFNFFLIRLDLGIKLKDPARVANGGWLTPRSFTWQNREFESVGRPVRNNYAIQLGIGMPF